MPLIFRSLLLFALSCITLAAQIRTSTTDSLFAPLSALAPGTAGNSATALSFTSVIPPKLVNDIFGQRLSLSYLALQVTVFNTNPERDLIINDVSIDYGAFFGDQCAVEKSIAMSSLTSGGGSRGLAGLANVIALQRSLGVKLSSTDAAVLAQLSAPTEMTEAAKYGARSTCQTSSHELSILRGVAEKGQMLDPRNYTYRILQAVATVGGALTGVAGLGPVLPKAVAAFSGPGITAFTTAFPDFTVNQMNRLSDAAYAANTIVPKQRSKVLVAFIPLALFFDSTSGKQFRKDPYSAFVGLDGKVGLKDLRVRVEYNFIVSTQDVPPILTAASLEVAEVKNLLDKKDAHGSITGRFLDGASVTVSNPELTAKLDSAKESTDTRLFFVLTPSKAVLPATIEFVVTKNKESAKISSPVNMAQPMPSLTKVDPPTGTVGADLDIAMTGNNLYDLNPSLKITRNGTEEKSIQSTNLNIVSTTSAKATLSLKNASAGKVDIKLVIGGIETGTVPFEVKPK